MHDKDFDKKIDSGRGSGDMGGSRSQTSGGSSRSSGGSGDRMRNRGDSGGDMGMPDDGAEDLQRKQSEGRLGNERVRGVGE